MIAVALCQLVVVWFVLAAIMAGVGLLIRRALGGGAPTSRDAVLAPWLGWCGVLGLLQVWHLFVAVGPAALALVAVIGLCGLGFEARTLGRLVAANRRRLVPAAAVLLVCAFWLADHALQQPNNYDSALYHLNAVRWAREYPIVPGLANLHGRLGFNSATFLYTAMLDFGPLAHRSHQAASGFLVLLMLGVGLHGWLSVLARAPASVGARECFYAAFVSPMVAWAVTTGQLSSPSPDLPAFLLGAMASGELLGLIERPGTAVAPRRAAMAGVCILAMAAILVRSNLAVFGIVAGGIAWVVHGRGSPRREWGLSLALVAGLALLLLVPWSLRSVILTGYVAYPLPIGRLPVDWAVPAAAARSEMDWIKAWGRTPGCHPAQVLQDWAWLRPWLARTIRESGLQTVAPVLTALAGAAVLLWRQRCGRPSGWPRACWLALVPALAGELAWFWSAPNPRFQGSLPWVIGLGALVLALPRAGRLPRIALAVHGLVILFLFVSPRELLTSWEDPGAAFRVPMVSQQTESGLVVLVPAEGRLVWDSDLPATPRLDPTLRLRGPGDLARGFMKAGTRDAMLPEQP